MLNLRWRLLRKQMSKEKAVMKENTVLLLKIFPTYLVQAKLHIKNAILLGASSILNLGNASNLMVTPLRSQLAKLLLEVQLQLY